MPGRGQGLWGRNPDVATMAGCLFPFLHHCRDWVLFWRLPLRSLSYYFTQVNPDESKLITVVLSPLPVVGYSQAMWSSSDYEEGRNFRRTSEKDQANPFSASGH